MKKMFIAAATLALTAGTAFAAPVRIASEGAYPPYNLVNDSGDLDGFDIAVGNEVCKRAELECVWVKNDWDSILPNLKSSNYDAIMAGMSITEERQQEIQFTQNYFPPAASAYAALSADTSVAEDAVVAAQTATIQAAHVAESGATLLEFATPDETVSAVRNGEADAVFADKDFLEPIVTESNGELSWVGDDVPLGGGIGIGLRQSDTELRDQMNAALTEMKEDGTLNALIEEWFIEGAMYFGPDGEAVEKADAEIGELPAAE
ncbi:transporter substrate-binding domain-containing protein [Paracoccus sediminicola]|uniref:transporter substrate-binding domain-containing protein n=1 Tax=Paracoccus sediminicola TaxID=3017783 RepID=UPI0022F11273|nr:transporter substrate-binding domain-containing protein [Paracoccus sediminicola]WBU55946.1 transporter substrate-binding domain-containing protein [Paracoccus sediminicola]